jgi:alpha-beta hydrolase superfamily lysophospholipase
MMDRKTATRDKGWLKQVMLAWAVLSLAACAPFRQGAFLPDGEPLPGFAGETFTTFDGARLGLSQWTPAGDEPVKSVIIAVHGMNDYAGAFRAAGPWWAKHGVAVYAYDQRGFGRSPKPGVWADPELFRQDLRTAVAVARQQHPGARLAVVAESMGAAVAMTAFASPPAPSADALILSSPGLRGWGAIPLSYSLALWTSAHVRPDWVVVPPKGLGVVATDNNAKLREMWYDPLILKDTRIDAVYGVVSLMEEADAATAHLSPDVPTLLLYGGQDQVIPVDGVKRAAARLPGGVRTAYYPKGYHLLLNDLAAEERWNDILAFLADPAAPLPSGAGALPWLGRAGQMAKR